MVDYLSIFPSRNLLSWNILFPLWYSAAAVMLHALEDHEFHLSLVGDASGDYMLDWVTRCDSPSNNLDPASTLYVRALDSSETTSIIRGEYSGRVHESRSTTVCCWCGRLENLDLNRTYVYYVDSPGSVLTTFTPVDPHLMTWAIFGDLGTSSQGRASGVSLLSLRQAVHRGLVHGIFHLGDISYELENENGRAYMLEMEEMVNQVPLHTTVGNHEVLHAPHGTLHNYLSRFSGQAQGLGLASKSHSSLYYSLNAGYVHFVVLNTEFYGDEPMFYDLANDDDDDDDIGNNSTTIRLMSEEERRRHAQTQALWLTRDLTLVNRSATPFVVMLGHRPPFRMPREIEHVDSRAFVEELLPLLDSVDLYICGHVHAYVRTKETIFGGHRIPPIVVSGSAGSNAFLEKESTTSLGRSFRQKKLVTFLEHYGYGTLSAGSSKELLWQWGRTAVEPWIEKPDPMDWELMDVLRIPNRKNDESHPVEENLKPVRKSVSLVWIVVVMAIITVAGMRIIKHTWLCWRRGRYQNYEAIGDRRI